MDWVPESNRSTSLGQDPGGRKGGMKNSWGPTPLTNIQTTGQWASASQPCSHPCCGTAQLSGERLSPYSSPAESLNGGIYKYNGLGYWAWFQAIQTPFWSWDLSSLNTGNPSPILILLLGVLQKSEFLRRRTQGLYGP